MIEKLVSEADWNDALAGLPAFSMPSGPVVFLAPHPDDESLAAGGLLAFLADRGTPLIVIAITDGDAAYDPNGDSRLAEVRRREQTAALAVLGVPEDQIVRLGLPDRYVHDHEVELVQRLVSFLEAVGPAATLMAPWRFDFHSDHEATGRAAEAAAAQSGVRLVRWFWWSWHRRNLSEVSVLPLKRFDLEAQWAAKKLAALAEHRSQLGEEAILPMSLLDPAHRSFEVFA